MVESKFSQEVLQVKGLIDKRIGQLKQVQRVLTFGKSQTELVLKEFTDSLNEFVSILNSSDVNFLANEIEKIHTQTLSEIPIRELDSITAVGTMHNKFKALTASVLNSEYLPDFFQGIVKEGCDLIAAEGDNLVSGITSLKNSVTSHINEIANYLNSVEADSSKDFVNKILNNTDQIINDSQQMYTRMIKLINNIKATNGFSNNVIDEIMTNAESLINNFGTEGVKNPAIAFNNIRSYLSAVDEIDYKINSLKSYGSDLQNMKSSFENLDISKVMHESFGKIINNGSRVLSLAQSAIDAAKSGNAQALTQSVNAVISQVSYIKGMLGRMSKQNIKNVIPAFSEIESEFNNLKNTALNFVNTFPNEALRIFKNDIKTIVKVTEDLAKNISNLNAGKRPSIANILTIGTRIAQKSSEITVHIGDLLTAVKSFKPTFSEPALNAIAALKKVAPTPMEAMVKGNLLTFTRSLDNPALLTKIGACQQAINDAMKDPNITTTELGMLTTLLDFVNGEHTREIMDMFVTDLDLQKSMAVQSLDLYIKEILEPKKRLLDEYIKLVTNRKGE